MSPNYTTIITPIMCDRPGRVDELRTYLRNLANPVPCPTQPAFLQCQSVFPFHKVKCLHFCSFSVLDADDEFGPSLVFEATFDGPRDDFLRQLWRVAPAGMNAVYSNCQGYPASGLDVPSLIEEYLVDHDVGANTYYLGSPGRSVAQVQKESRLRAEVFDYLAHRQPADVPNFSDLQHDLQRDVVRARDEHRWAEQPPDTPWEVKYRSWVAGVTKALAVVLVLGLGALAVRALFELGPCTLQTWIEISFGRLWQIGLQLADSKHPGWEWLATPTRQLHLPTLYVALALVAAWLAARGAELVIGTRTENPHDQSFGWRLGLHIVYILKWALPVFLVGLVALSLITIETATDPTPPKAQSQVKEFVLHLDDIWARWVVSGALLAIIFAIWLALRYYSKTLKLKVQFQELTSSAENWRLFWLDVLRFARVVLVLLAALVLARHFPEAVAKLAKDTRPWVLGYLVAATYALAGILAVYVIACTVLVITWILERSDLKAFQPAEKLVSHPRANAHVYAREEGGINRYQNHLFSVTHVKPGLLRRWLLRSTLCVINLLARFWYNRGNLGGIPTILSARWVLIDGGRRLLFLDNYGGAWNSYLNEFIDMGAVKGLNAIWTNTFVKAGPATRCAYPPTSFYLWKGAQAEPEFKAYVRQSQVETLVWYSAYPRLSITNVNTNTALREALFRPLASCDLDAIIQRL